MDVPIIHEVPNHFQLHTHTHTEGQASRDFRPHPDPIGPSTIGLIDRFDCPKEHWHERRPHIHSGGPVRRDPWKMMGRCASVYIHMLQHLYTHFCVYIYIYIQYLVLSIVLICIDIYK